MRAVFPLRSVLFITLVLATAGLSMFAFLRGWIDAESLNRWIIGDGPAAMATYVFSVFLLEVLWFPRIWGLLAGGLLFGPLRAIFLSATASIASAVVCYHFARNIRQERLDMFTRAGRQKGIMKLIDQLAGNKGMVTMMMARMMSHWTALSYAAGLTRMSFRDFLWGTIIGMIPGSIVYTYAGSAAREPSGQAFAACVAICLGLVVVTALVRRLVSARS